jgi:hypothetical protein
MVMAAHVKKHYWDGNRCIWLNRLNDLGIGK